MSVFVCIVRNKLFNLIMKHFVKLNNNITNKPVNYVVLVNGCFLNEKGGLNHYTNPQNLSIDRFPVKNYVIPNISHIPWYYKITFQIFRIPHDAFFHHQPIVLQIKIIIWDNILNVWEFGKINQYIPEFEITTHWTNFFC